MKNRDKILLIAALFFLVEFSVSPLLHNHQPRLIDNYTCPAFILSVTLVSFAIALAFKQNRLRKFFELLPTDTNNTILINTVYTFLLRAPPALAQHS